MKTKYLIVLLSLITLSCSSIVNKVTFHPDTKNLILTSKLPKNVTEKYIATEDGLKIHSLYIQNKSSNKLLIYFHGNAGNIFHRLPDLLKLSKFGLNVLGVSYRGYGKSLGNPSELGLYLDGEGALKYAKEKLGFEYKNIFLFGRSIGTTVAVNTTMNKSIKGLILVSPLTNGKEQAKNTSLSFVSFLAGNSFNNISKTSKIKCPVLIIHGTEDNVIPFSMGEEIFEKIKSKKQFVKIQGGGHNNLSSKFKSQYWLPIYNFIIE